MITTDSVTKILIALCAIAVVSLSTGCKKEEPTAPTPTPSTPDTTPPSVVITYPANAATLTAPIIIKADATDNIGVAYVEFFIDGVSTSKDSTAPYEQFWNVGYWADGNLHTVLAKAADKGGNTGQSQLVTVTVSTTAALAVLLNTPADSTIIDSAAIKLRWYSALDAFQYQVEVSSKSDFSTIDFITTIAETSLTTTPLSPFLHYWRVRAQNRFGLWGGWSLPRRFYRWATFGGTDWDEARSVQQTTDGGYVFVGSSNNTGYYYGSSVYLVKSDQNGNKVWEKFYVWSSGAYHWGHCVKQTNDGGYIVAFEFGSAYPYLFLIKTDANGNQIWLQGYGTGYSSAAYSTQQTTDGGYIVGGYLYTGQANSEDVCLVKADPSGNQVWLRTFGENKWDHGYSVLQTFDGGFVIVGFKGTNQLPVDSAYVYLIKTDLSGNKLWENIYGTPGSWGKDIKETTDKGFIIVGQSGDGKIYLIKTDSVGNKTWERIFDSGLGNSVQQTSDGGYIIVGTTAFYPRNVILIKTDPNGNQLWRKFFDGGGDDLGNSVQQTRDGGFIIAGQTSSFGLGSSDAFLIKTDANGDLWSR